MADISYQQCLCGLVTTLKSDKSKLFELISISVCCRNLKGLEETQQGSGYSWFT